MTVARLLTVEVFLECGDCLSMIEIPDLYAMNTWTILIEDLRKARERGERFTCQDCGAENDLRDPVMVKAIER